MVMETQSKQRIPIFAVAQAKLGFVQKGGGGGGQLGYPPASEEQKYSIIIDSM